MRINFCTRGEIIESEEVGDLVISTWYRRTSHGSSGELCTSITTAIKNNEGNGLPIKQIICLDSVTSYVKWNEDDIPERHHAKVSKMLKKHSLKGAGKCQAS